LAIDHSEIEVFFMSLKQIGTRYFLFFLLAVPFVPYGKASTITVVPSEAQPQIQASINNSHVGDTISFQAGTYVLGLLRLQPGRSYIGAANGQTIIHGYGGYALMVFYGSGLTVQHITFDGGGLYLGGAISNVNVEYNTFQNIAFGRNGTTEFGNWTSTIGVFMDTSAVNTDISHNSFRNLATQVLSEYADNGLGVTAIFGFNVNNTTITYNTFDTVNEGIHIFSLQNTVIDHNTITHFHRIGMEFQNNSRNLEVAYNTISQPITPFWLTYGISAAITGGNANVHDNLIDDQVEKTCGSGCWIGYGIEAWGNGTVITNNTIQGHWGNGVAIGPSTNLQVIKNKICGPEMGEPGGGFVDNQDNTRWPGEVMANNATSTALTCP
jgi:Right handed beta helix region